MRKVPATRPANTDSASAATSDTGQPAVGVRTYRQNLIKVAIGTLWRAGFVGFLGFAVVSAPFSWASVVVVLILIVTLVAWLGQLLAKIEVSSDLITVRDGFTTHRLDPERVTVSVTQDKYRNRYNFRRTRRLNFENPWTGWSHSFELTWMAEWTCRAMLVDLESTLGIPIQGREIFDQRDDFNPPQFQRW